LMAMVGQNRGASLPPSASRPAQHRPLSEMPVAVAQLPASCSRRELDARSFRSAAGLKCNSDRFIHRRAITIMVLFFATNTLAHEMPRIAASARRKGTQSKKQFLDLLDVCEEIDYECVVGSHGRFLGTRVDGSKKLLVAQTLNKRPQRLGDHLVFTGCIWSGIIDSQSKASTLTEADRKPTSNPGPQL
jgi:hypothetical protein